MKKFRAERDSTKKQTKVICVLYILFEDGDISIAEKIDGELDDDGIQSKWCTFRSIPV